jgi:multidrug resistance efflux pump
MLDTDGLFRLATTNFQQAETHLTDCEVQLRKLRAKLDKYTAQVCQAPQEEPIWQQVKSILNGEVAGATAGARETA